MELHRVTWSITTAICLVAAVLLLLRGMSGYALVAFAVAVSAVINVR